jgi:hypothetical protein
VAQPVNAANVIQAEIDLLNLVQGHLVEAESFTGVV